MPLPVLAPSRISVRYVDSLDDYDAPLDSLQMRRLLSRMNQVLADESRELPEQEVLLLWWGTQEAERPIQVAVGLLYNGLLDWQEGNAAITECRKGMREQARRLWKVLGADDS